jgi:hypothetical protein
LGKCLFALRAERSLTGELRLVSCRDESQDRAGGLFARCLPLASMCGRRTLDAV